MCGIKKKTTNSLLVWKTISRQKKQLVRFHFFSSSSFLLLSHIDNTQTQQLQAEINTLRSDNTRLQNEVTRLEASTTELQTTLDSIQNADPVKAAEEETKRVLDRLAKWIPDDRQYDEPGYDLQDDCVMGLLGMWQTDESVRQAALQWMSNYMKKV